MPKIINAYADGSSSIADSLSKLGESIYGDQAKNEFYRQKAFGSKRENDNIPLLADAVARGDRNAIARFGVMSNKTGQDTGDFNRLGVSNHASSVDDPTLALAIQGAGGAFSSTAPGQGRELANRVTTTGMNNNASRDVARIQADKTAQSDKYRFDNTYENTYDPESGRTILTPRSQAAGKEVAPTKDSVVGGMLRRVATGQQAADGTNADPFAGLSPQMQHVAGVAVPEQSMIEPRSGMTGTSRDGGQTVILPNGAKIPSTGFQQVGQETAFNQARDNNVRAGAGQAPLNINDPTRSQATADARNTTGLGPAIGTIANHELGAVVGPGVIKAVTGSPEIAPATQDARQRQELRNNEARQLLSLNPGRQTDQQRALINDLLPQGSAFANSATEAKKIPHLVNQLAQDHEQYRQLVINPNTPPAERQKAAEMMHKLEASIQKFTTPEAGAVSQPAQAAVQPAGAPRVPISGADSPQAGMDPLTQARNAIAQGAPRAAVIQRLQQHGINPEGL